MSLPRVNVIVLGGTITMAPSSLGGITPTLTGEDLVRQVPGLDRVAELNVHTPFLKPGASLTMAEIAQVARLIAADSDAAGAVVVQGTDTIDETSFLLALLHQAQTPVVVTGAMRGAAALSADGPANLMAAVATAAHPDSRGRGALVVLNDEIHDAVYAEKAHKGLVDAFQSPSGGPLGYYFEGSPRYLSNTPRRTIPGLNTVSSFGKVAIIKTVLDDSDELLRALSTLGYTGLVIEAMGAGHVPKVLVPALELLATQMPVVLASRVMGGPIFRRTYAFPGSEMDLLARGLIPAGWLSPHKARLLLAALLGADAQGNAPINASTDQDRIREAFAVFDI